MTPNSDLKPRERWQILVFALSLGVLAAASCVLFGPLWDQSSRTGGIPEPTRLASDYPARTPKNADEAVRMLRERGGHLGGEPVTDVALVEIAVPRSEFAGLRF